MGHDTHHSTNEKKVHFGASVIMGLSFWLFAFFFLSLCNGKKQHSNEHHDSSHSAVEQQVKTPQNHH